MTIHNWFVFFEKRPIKQLFIALGSDPHCLSNEAPNEIALRKTRRGCQPAGMQAGNDPRKHRIGPLETNEMSKLQDIG